MTSPSYTLLLHDFAPRSQLVVGSTAVTRPRFPAIDAHNHLGPEFGGNWIARPVEELVAVLDSCDIRQLVDLDGGWGEAILDAHLAYCKERYPERFRVFGGINWTKWAEEGNRFGEAAARRLEAQVRRGAEGLKVWKLLGLHVRDERGLRAPVDDPRLDPVWACAGELGIPVLIHTADPVAFFDPIDRFNEQYEILQNHPEWAYPASEFPPFAQLMEELSSLLSRHPRTTFIAAHVASYPENLGWVGAALDAHANLYVDIAARINELGRQPYAARDFFIRYQDRILFGADVPADASYYGIYFRFLESRDDYFPYGPEDVPWLGRWRIYGLGLPDEVLEKVYWRNAQRAILRRHGATPEPHA